MSEHTFDKLRVLDCTFAEFEAAMDTAEVIQETALGTSRQGAGPPGRVDTSAPPVVVVDQARSEERIVTVYEPDDDRWSADFRRRR